MVEVSQRTGIRGPTFIRMLAGLTDLDVAAPGASLSQRLGEWIDWNHAVALATALDAAPDSEDGATGQADDAACARLRASLARTIAEDRAFAPQAGPAADAPPDYLFYRQRCQALQQTLEARIGQLREQLRERLRRHGPATARLAAVDAAMERALLRRERNLLAAVPNLLGQHFERLRRNDSPTWLIRFQHDMQQVLLAELEVRLHPVEGLSAALAPRTTESHAQKTA